MLLLYDSISCIIFKFPPIVIYIYIQRILQLLLVKPLGIFIE